MGKYTAFYNQKIFNMKKSLVFATILMMAVSCATTKQTPEGMVNPENKKEWKLVWKDEFNYKDKAQLLKVWESANGPEGHILCSRWEENIELGDGTLRLVNHKENRGGQEWTSGSIWTRRDFMYGYYECRYKIAAAPRTNSSFWITSRDKSKTPEKGLPFEIDINEGHYPSEYTTCIHDCSISGPRRKSNPGAKMYPGTDFSKEYHTYGLEWTEDEMVFYIDRKEFRRVRNEFSKSPAPLFLSEAILKWGDEKVTDAIEGTFMEVDYVRVYSRK